MVIKKLKEALLILKYQIQTIYFFQNYTIKDVLIGFAKPLESYQDMSPSNQILISNTDKVDLLTAYSRYCRCH